MITLVDTSLILTAAKIYIRKLFQGFLSADLPFHNFRHTLNVVEATQEIGEALKLDEEQLELVQLAAWFHDSGHVLEYHGHELKSQKLARIFMSNYGYPAEKIAQVLSCIAATTAPQKPQNLLEEVICDADLHHLAQEDYPVWQELLREEWNRALGWKFSDEDWREQNLNFLRNHQYFTPYARRILSPRKQKNISLFE